MRYELPNPNLGLGTRSIDGLTEAKALLMAAAISLDTQSELLRQMKQIGFWAQEAILPEPKRIGLERKAQYLLHQIRKISSDSEFNGLKLLDGSFGTRRIKYGTRPDEAILVHLNGFEFPYSHEPEIASGGSESNFDSSENSSPLPRSVVGVSTALFALQVAERYRVRRSAPGILRRSMAQMAPTSRQQGPLVLTTDQARQFVQDIDAALLSVQADREQVDYLQTELERIFRNQAPAESVRPHLTLTEKAEQTQAQILNEARAAIQSQANAMRRNLLSLNFN